MVFNKICGHGLVISFVIFFSSCILALDTGQEMTITLHANEKETVDIGKISFTAEKNGYQYEIALDENIEKYFLSMHPFQCLKNPEVMVCHLPYPYQNNKFISSDDMVDLEYDLMFLHKKTGGYGIDPWNGIYYKMKLNENGIEGVLHDTDMNVLTAPPEDGNLRPLTHDLLYEANPAKHWFPTISIH